MNNLPQKLFYIGLPIIIIIFTGILSHYSNFAFMNYSFIVSKNIFSLFSLGSLLLVTNSYYVAKDNLNLDGRYLYKLHLLLINIWLFLFFLYHEYVISFFTVLFNLIILCLLTLHLYKFRKKLLLNIVLYALWFMYTVVVNLLIL